MGLIKAAKDAIGSTMHDQWKEAIRGDITSDEMIAFSKTLKNLSDNSADLLS